MLYLSREISSCRFSRRFNSRKWAIMGDCTVCTVPSTHKYAPNKIKIQMKRICHQYHSRCHWSVRMCSLPVANARYMRGECFPTTLSTVSWAIVYHSNVCMRAAYMEKYLKSLRAQLAPGTVLYIQHPLAHNKLCLRNAAEDISHDTRLFEINFFCSQ